ncbi:claspin [Rhinophrynus dorsalis]
MVSIMFSDNLLILGEVLFLSLQTINFQRPGLRFKPDPLKQNEFEVQWVPFQVFLSLQMQRKCSSRPPVTQLQETCKRGSAGTCLGTDKIFLEVQRLESDSDSGQGSCEMASPGDQNKSMDCLEDGDSDEEILVVKKSKNKKILEESDSDGEVERSTVTANIEINAQNEEESRENISVSGKPWRVRSAMLDSDDSDKDNEMESFPSKDEIESIRHESDRDSQEEMISLVRLKKGHKSSKQVEHLQEENVKSKSKRRMDKEEKKMASIRKLKKDKKQKSKIEEVPPLNDSGCLLADGDLFENELGNESVSAEEEESLDAIRANVKGKLKSHSSEGNEMTEHEREIEGKDKNGEKRKERKAALVSKEAIKQLHSETQRLLRESAVSLPYHLPEPKTIHDFFKRRPRPVCQGNAMQLLKSTKYQPCIAEENMTTNDSSQKETQICESVPTTESKMDQELSPLEPLCSEVTNLNEGVKTSCAEENKSVTAVGNTEINVNSIPCESNFVQTDSNHVHEEGGVNMAGETQNEISTTQPEGTLCEQIQTGVQRPVITRPVQNKAKQSKLEKLRALGVDLSLKPRLCPDDGSFVNLDEPKPNKELEALKERFLKHTSHKAKPTNERKINLNIVRKETTADGKEELKADTVPVTVTAENSEEKVYVKPGEKLQILKSKLQEAMKLRRSEERQKRQALYNLDNEDGFEDEEEEEEELTDDSEEDEEGNAETVENLLGAEEENEEEEETTKEEAFRVSVNEVSITASRPVTTESTLMLFKDNSTKMGDSLPDKMEHDEGECRRHSKLGDEEDYLLPQLKDNSHNSSFELISSMIPSYQPFNKTARGNLHSSMGGFRSPSPVNFKTSFLSSASKSSGKMSEPSLPVEDSQDLYNASPEPKASYLCAGANSQFQFSLEDDTQSQLLDADGFLNVGHNRSKYSSAKHRLALDTMDENAMDANMGELLDLCSGQFKDSGTTQADGNETTKAAMDELLELCSGKFVSQADCSTQDYSAPVMEQSETEKTDSMSKAVALCSDSFPVDRGEEEDEEEEFGDFQLLPCNDSDGSEEGESDGSENEEEKDDDFDEDEEVILRQQQGKRKLKLTDFMEDEAELSGSDLGSGDEEEEDDDEYEEEAIDEDLPSDEELQDQVNKIHMKVTMDEDQRKLRLYQERYLADGDLHSDGPGRMRKFRWKHLDDASQLDMFRRDSEIEDQEGENDEVEETELKWRKERFEREQWMREQSQGGCDDQEEEFGGDSQFMKLAKKVTAKALQKKVTSADSSEPKKPGPKNPFEVNRPFILPKMRTGSLLNKPKEVLQKLAAMSDLNPNAPRNSRNFVFQTLSPGKREHPSEKAKPQVRKNISVATPSPKRLRLENSSSRNSRSIFPFLES